MILKAICLQAGKFVLNFLAVSPLFDNFHLPSPSLYTLARLTISHHSEQILSNKKSGSRVRLIVGIAAIQLSCYKWLLSQLLAASAVTISGVIYVVVLEIATTLGNDNRYDHYRDRIMQGNLWIGN